MKRLCTGMLFILLVMVIDCGGGLPGDAVTVGGQVLLTNGTPVEGVEMVFFMPDPPNVNSDGTWTVLTDENGWYSDYLYTLWRDRDVSITPNHPAYVFSPTGYALPGAYEDRLDLDFTALSK